MTIKHIKTHITNSGIFIVLTLALLACTSQEEKRDKAIAKIDKVLSKTDKNGVKAQSIEKAYKLLETIPNEFAETISIQKCKIDRAYYDRELSCCEKNYVCGGEYENDHNTYIKAYFDEIYDALGATYILSKIGGAGVMPTELEHLKIEQFEYKKEGYNSLNKSYNSIIDMLVTKAIEDEDFVAANSYIEYYRPYYEMVSRKFIKKDNGFLGDGKDIFNYKTRPINAAQKQARLKLDCIRLIESIEDDFNMAKFTRGSAMLNEHAKDALDRLFILMKKNDGIAVKFIGHTSVDGSEETNLTLSRERAKAAAKYLESKGIRYERLGYEGKGCTQLINQFDPTSEENCRIDIILL